jgi:hypothetical protein
MEDRYVYSSNILTSSVVCLRRSNTNSAFVPSSAFVCSYDSFSKQSLFTYTVLLIGLYTGSTVFCVRYGMNLFQSTCLSMCLLAGMFCRKELYHDSSAVSRCIALRISPASCSKCRDRRLGSRDLFRVKVGCLPEMVDVRLRGQAISSLPHPPP